MRPLRKRGTSTTAVHAGEIRTNEYGAITTPIVQSSTFIFRNADEIRKLKAGAKDRFEYGRYGHPTQFAAECWTSTRFTRRLPVLES
jgi:cystathionine gamma-synthase